MPKTEEEKIKDKEDVIQIMSVMEKRICLAKNCLMLSGTFAGDHLVMAKNETLEIIHDAERVEHMLHEIIDAPSV